MKNLDKKLSISIVNFNSGEYLTECLKSLERVKGELNFDVWVVDNASTDDSFIKAKKLFPQINLIGNKQNLGFGKAHNQVAKIVDTQYILFLNPDTKVLPGTLKFMAELMDKNANIGISGCRVEKADGTLDWASHRGFPTPWASLLYHFLKNDSLYHQTDKNMSQIHEVDCLVGAFMFARKSVLDKVGYFDEDYFLYAEDIDLCFRVKEAGFKIIYAPDVKVVHLKGVSSGIKKHSQNISQASAESRKKSLDYFYSTMILFYKKHLQSKYPFFINWLVFFGIKLKWFIAKRSLTV
ncbi:glycosyltransferase family 2 protein [Candidatus Daviesbacteria bacterium]|nr:glycosyltransferase family 2 protein [Candidatus Daviesbacteria bacterium]